MKPSLVLFLLVLAVNDVPAQVQFSATTSDSVFVSGQAISVFIYAKNLSDTGVTLNFGECEVDWYLDSQLFSYACIPAFSSRYIPPHSTHTWFPETDLELGSTNGLSLGRHAVVPEVIGYWSDTVWITVIPPTTFAREYGGSGIDRAYAVSPTGDGGYLVAGDTRSFGAGSSDIYLLKTNNFGDTMWTKTYGGINSDGARAVEGPTGGGYIISGYTASFGAGLTDFYLLKTDSAGDTLWTRTYGGANYDEAWASHRTFDGGYVVIGWTESFGAGADDIYLVKTNSSGDTLWTKTYGGPGRDIATAVQQTADKGYIIAGWTDSYGAGSADVYLVKTDSLGDTLWTRTYGGSGDDYGTDVQVLGDGYLITGYTSSFGSGASDVYLIRADTAGNPRWTKTYGGAGSEYATTGRKLGFDRYIVAGYTDSYGSGSGDMYLILADDSGGVVWSRTFGGTGHDEGRAVAQVGADGGFVVAGWTGSAGSGTDVFLVKTDANGIVTFVGNEPEPTRPVYTYLRQNYPNPFNPVTKITYALSKACHVRLTVYDLLGEEIEHLVDADMPPGIWSAKFDGSKNASGMYFYKLLAGEHTEVKKMMLVK